MSEKQDKIIICRNCGKEFVFSVGEQRFFEEKGLSEPVRCKDCKAKRKEQSSIKEENIEKKQREHKENKNDFEEMLRKFQENTILFEEERVRRENKKKRR